MKKRIKNKLMKKRLMGMTLEEMNAEVEKNMPKKVFGHESLEELPETLNKLAEENGAETPK